MGREPRSVSGPAAASPGEMAPVAPPRPPALLIIDVQQGFEDPRWGARNNPDAERVIARLLAAWRQAGATVVHVRHDSREPQSPLCPGQPGNRIKLAVAPLDGETVIAKSVNSAFIGTPLESELRRRGVTELVIVGLTTNHCVSTTARMAGNLGFITFVVADATATFDHRAIDGTMRPAADVHAAALSDLAEEFATVIAADRALETLLPRSSGIGRN